MHLKRLELYGYKSFASRVSFEFGQGGITAVVGPNGSGKSNIADAIRWVMGEQSYSALRAKTTQDMIFAGTRQRARLGMAEVILTLDNSDGQLPIDFTEVTVGRRAFRSGENEYLLNGNRVRYRDILSLLGGVGLARSNYTVVGQGLVDAALSLRPEARRALFEEAAGITPELRKRDQALARIEETERNLERASDILAELQPRGARLRRQAERAEEHALLSQDLQELQRIWYGYHWQRSQRDLQKATLALREQEAHIEAHRHYAAELRERQQGLGQQEQEQRQTIDQLQVARRSLREEAEVQRRELAVVAERLRLVAQQQKAGEVERETLASRERIVLREAESAAIELAQHQATWQACQEELAQAQVGLSQIDAQREQLQKSRRAMQAELGQARNNKSTAEARLEQSQGLSATAGQQASEAQRQLDQLSPRQGQLDAATRAAAERQSAQQSEQEELVGKAASASQEIEALEPQIAEREAETSRHRAELDRLRTRLDLLTRVRQELTGYVPGVRAALAQERPGILGTVANLVEVPSEIERAIESALGSRLQNIVTETWDAAEAAIEELKRSRSGWATFLPLDTLRSGSGMALPRGEGIVGVASQLVRYEERVRPAIELLLGRILIVEDLPAARRLLRQRTGATLLVTLDGETAQPSGVLSGGSRKNTTNLLAQEREWRQLPKLVRAQQQRLDLAQQDLQQAREELSQLRAQQSARSRDLQALRAELQTTQSALAEAQTRLRELERDRAWFTGQAEAALKAGAKAKADAEQQRQELMSLQEIEARLTSQLRELEQQLAAVEDDALRRQVAELETRAAVAERTVTSQERLLASHRRNLEQIREQIEAKAAQIATQVAQLVTLEARNDALQAAAAQTSQRDLQLVERMRPAETALQELAQRGRELEQQYLQSQERLREAELALSRATLECDRLGDRRTALGHDIEADLGPIDLPETMAHQLRLSLGDDIIELPPVETLPPGLGEEIRNLRTRLRRIGTINPDAPQEYEQLLERQTFLHSQASDLRGAIASLHEVIQELDEIIERDFVRTVRQVDKSFGEYFRTLFSGGTARLEMTDPENAHSTGIEIMAHPPGKRAQNLSLLSGGERALTAVALLFALLDANPVPFCFLDEVDAALDESNVYRFRELLQNQAAGTQFIVITHNRRTIEIAATIYGVSMSEAGVSQTVSLQLDDSAEIGPADEAVEARALASDGL